MLENRIWPIGNARADHSDVVVVVMHLGDVVTSDMMSVYVENSATTDAFSCECWLQPSSIGSNGQKEGYTPLPAPFFRGPQIYRCLKPKWVLTIA